MDTFNDVINLWPSPSDLAADIGAPYGVVKQWRWRNSIPATYWADLIRAAQGRGFDGVTAEKLTELARGRRRQTAEAAA